MKRMRVQLAICFLVGLCWVSPTSATPTDAAAITVTVGATAVAGTVGTPAAGLAVGAATGATELGYFICVAIFGWGDPPDLVNYATRASPSLLIPNLPFDPSASPELNQAAQDTIAGWSQVVQSLKGMQQSRDRLGGAQLVGTPTDVANQQQWLAEFTAEVKPRLLALAAPMQQYNSLLAIEFPAFYSYNPSLADTIQMRDDEAAGNFPSAEQLVLEAWELSDFEVDLVRNHIGEISDTVLAQSDHHTIGSGLSSIQSTCTTGACGSDAAPEPGTFALLGLGSIIGAIVLRRRLL